MKIKGKIQKGHNEATRTLKLQKKFFEYHIDCFDKFHLGTINLILEKPLKILKADYEIPPIQWDTDQAAPIPSEKFEFVNVQIEVGTTIEDALIYIAHSSPHYLNNNYIEILAPKVNLENNEFCNIIINKKIKENNGCFVIE